MIGNCTSLLYFLIDFKGERKNTLPTLTGSKVD